MEICNFLPYPTQNALGFERFRIFCRHGSKRNSKPTIPNTLTIVGGRNRTLSGMEICNFLPYPTQNALGFEQFCIFCRRVSKCNDKPTVPNTLTIVGGWNSKRLYLASMEIYKYPLIAGNLLHYPLKREALGFCIFCRLASRRNDKPTIPNTLSIVGGWNGKT